MAPLLIATAPQTAVSSTHKGMLYVTNGNAPAAAQLAAATSHTNAQDVGARTMVPKDALEARKIKALTPYKADAWRSLLSDAGLTDRYPHLPTAFQTGFSGNIPSITCTYIPPNSPSIIEHIKVFRNILEIEFAKGRFIGPFTAQELESIFGCFQTAPLSLVPKPGKPGKFRMVQNLSYPYHSTHQISSINSKVDSNLYPCTYGTFSTICLTIHRLPPGSQAAVRDVAEAYRTIPLHQSQWPGLVVRLSEDDSFAVDTSCCFGFSPSAGLYGNVADAGADIFRSKGIGPLSKWVDDHIFFRILKVHLEEYNKNRTKWAKEIALNGGAIVDGGRKWYKGATMPNDSAEEYDEDAHFPLQDLSHTSPRTSADAQFTYCIDDIDTISLQLGIPWEKSKDIPFSSHPTFLGFVWDIPKRLVSLSASKQAKYLAAVSAWQSKRTHDLHEAQKLHGKLIHASLIIPSGRAYLTNLERFLGIFDDKPFMPKTPPHHTQDDILWWKTTLSGPTISRPIPGPCAVHDFQAYSDASTSHGIGIIIKGSWRAWKLIPGWDHDGRDIGWAESIGFEFLIRSILNAKATGIHFKVFGDNQGIIEGWWQGRSRNRACNEVFKRIHQLLANSSCTVLTRYIPSEHNPADKPSRGIYPPASLLLPPICIPHELRPFIADIASLPPHQPIV